MAEIDVFISYKREERTLAESVANALKEEGYITLTDLNIQKADNFSDAIDDMIQSASLVLVLWTKASIGSSWVRKEAEEAELLGKYFGVLVDKLERNDLPLAVRSSQWLDISHKSMTEGITSLVHEVSSLAGSPKKAANEADLRSKALEGDFEFFQVVETVGELEGYKSYIKTYPDGVFSATAQKRIRELSRWYSGFKRFPIVSGTAALAAVAVAYFAAFPPASPETEIGQLQSTIESLRNENNLLRQQIPTVAAAEAATDVATGAVDLEEIKGQLGGIFSGATETLAGITDADSANAALPALVELGESVDSVSGLIGNIPEAARGPIESIASGGMEQLQPIIDKVMGLPGVGDIVGPVLAPIVDTMIALTG